MNNGRIVPSVCAVLCSMALPAWGQTPLPPTGGAGPPSQAPATAGGSPSDPRGSVTLNDNAGYGAASMLASEAIREAAGAISAELTEKRGEIGPAIAAGRALMIVPGKERPDVTDYLIYEYDLNKVNNAFDYADKFKNIEEKSIPEKKNPSDYGVLVPLDVSGIGTALDAINTVLAFFKTDYTEKGYNFTKTDYELAAAVGWKLGHSPVNRVDKVQVYGLTPPTGAITEMEKQLGKLDNRYWSALADRDKPVNSAHKAALKRAIDDYNSFVALISPKPTTPPETADAAGTHPAPAGGPTPGHVAAGAPAVPSPGPASPEKPAGQEAQSSPPSGLDIRKVMEEKSVVDAMRDDYLLYVNVDDAGGDGYTKKNIFTTFGAMPFYVQGSTAVSYALVDSNGKAWTNSISVGTPFLKVTDAPCWVQKRGGVCLCN